MYHCYLVQYWDQQAYTFPFSSPQANYGRKDTACAQRVKEVYRELDLQQVYRQYEEESYQRLMGVIEANAGSLPRGMFLEFADRIYQRKN